MTKDEAIKLIKDDIRLHHDSLSGTYRKALNMAIESLKTEAIPVEWMRQYIDEHGLYTTAMEAITAWAEQRKEE